MMKINRALVRASASPGFAALLLATLAPTTFGQGVARFESSGQEIGEEPSLNVMLGDIDGDGDLDALVNDSNAPCNTVLANDGTGRFTVVAEFPAPYDIAGADLMDLDGDGDPDVLGILGGFCIVKINSGSFNFTAGQEFYPTGWYEPSSASTLGDLDGDGDIDAWFTFESSCRIATNNGAGTFTMSPASYPTPHGESTALGDLDGDGDLDAFVLNGGGAGAGAAGNSVWLNNGTGSFTNSMQSLGADDSRVVRLGDTDGDGDLDAIVVNVGSTRIWKNDGTGVFTDSGERLDDEFVKISIALGDLDEDGDLDVFAANFGGLSGTESIPHPNKVWLNDGEGRFTATTQLLGEGWSFDVALGDLDGNGTLDAYVANSSPGAGGTPDRVWINYDYTAVNTTQDLFHADAAEAVAHANSGDTIVLYESAFEVEGVIDGRGLALKYEAVSDINFGLDLLFLPGNGSSFLDHADSGAGYAVSGRVVAPDNGTLIIGSLDVRLDLASSAIDPGELLQNDASLYMYSDLDNSSGITYLRGDVSADTVSTGADGINYVARDTDIYGDYDNAGSTIIQRGTLYIYGDLTNTGSMSGDVVNTAKGRGGPGPQPGDGMSIAGDYTIGPKASLIMPADLWRLSVGGDLDIGIDDPTRFEMSQASIVLTGPSPDSPQTFEAMGRDFPIGSLRISSGANVRLVNDRPNAPEDSTEEIHVESIVIEAGASLATEGLRIFTSAATIDGTVDEIDNIVITPPCDADINGDGEVDAADLGLLIGAWNTDGSITPGTDLNGDGNVDAADLGLLIGAWGSCA